MSLNIEISLNDFYELKNISEKVYYPLKKLVDKKNFLNILKNYRLTSGEIFPLPIFLDVEKKLTPAISKQISEMDPSLLFITGVGAVYPFIRTHSILTNLQNLGSLRNAQDAQDYNRKNTTLAANNRRINI